MKTIKTALLKNGLEIKGTYEQVKRWISDVKEFKGVSEFTYSENVLATINLETFSENKILDLRETFVDTRAKYAVIINDTEALLSTGEVKSILDLISSFKQDGRNIEFKAGDIVEIDKCFSNKTLITINTAMLKDRLTDRFGVVTRVNSGIAVVSHSSFTLRLPTMCLEKRINTILDETMMKIHSHIVTNTSTKVVIGNSLNYCSVSEDGKSIEYIDTSRLSRFGGDFWNKELRSKYAVNKKIRAVLKSIYVDCSDSMIDEVIMLYASSNSAVEVLTGNDILSVFKSDNCVSSGSIASSCMRNKDKGYFDIYLDSVHGIAVMKNDDNKIALRAIIWELEHILTGEKIMFMDRIYSGNTSLEPSMKGWAIKNGLCYLETQTYNQTRAKTPDGNEIELCDYFVKTKKMEYKNYPYIDTMCNFVRGHLFAYRTVKQLHSTGGGCSESL